MRASIVMPGLLLWAGFAILAPANLRAQAQPAGPTTAPPAAKSEPDTTQAPPAQSAPAVAKPCPATSQPTPASKPDCKAAGGNRKHKKHAGTPATTPSTTNPTKTVVRNGSTREPEVDLSPGVSQQQASKQVEDTNRLLVDTDSNLKEVSGRKLNASQSETLKQIRSYLQQAKTAANHGDWHLAYNLAHKANLLSADLAGQ